MDETAQKGSVSRIRALLVALVVGILATLVDIVPDMVRKFFAPDPGPPRPNRKKRKDRRSVRRRVGR